ncbi:hypothetical protein GGQ92_003205 [Gracilibacillus halotolerans]|uniref:DUF4145 domain-containing protein n=1 Tax=Gracilibacillus halotolerans TaxID=74386 RepID=A0A841RJD1_9BACI|nr:DUF4145 domain-containing protein [Gracilibacillus halotolerans]MBB6514380.1 hypothetical protein [Gracilibacillus halotolerans]
MTTYFYKFLEPVSEELARTLKELENAIYNSPRSMLTHSRTLIEAIMEKVMVHENMPNEPYLTIQERIEDLDKAGLLTEEVKDALHEVRRLGNIAAHDVRQFRYSESLNVGTHLYHYKMVCGGLRFVRNGRSGIHRSKYENRIFL